VLEIGHIFQLGTKYSESLGASFLDADGKQKPVIMGCYGIGVSRLIAAVIEQNNDGFGIKWPREVSPYDAIIMPLEAGNAPFMECAERIYRDLSSKGLRCLLDDRDERPGVKFKDADLIGISAQVVIGKASLASGAIEVKMRRSGEKHSIPEPELASRLRELIDG
jgi:prolyl-tRNA synthetase